MSALITVAFQKTLIQLLLKQILILLDSLIYHLQRDDFRVAYFALSNLESFLYESFSAYFLDLQLVGEFLESARSFIALISSGALFSTIPSKELLLRIEQAKASIILLAEFDDELIFVAERPNAEIAMVYIDDCDDDHEGGGYSVFVVQQPSEHYFHLKCFRESDNFLIYTATFPTKLAAYDGFDVCTKIACDMSITGIYRWQVLNEGEEILRELWSDSVPIRVSGETIDFLPCYALD